MSSNIEIMEMKIVHYGDNHFSLNKFVPVEDLYPTGWVKPKGGLWTSPVNSSFGWKEWCEAESFQVHRLKKNFKLRYRGKTIVIDSLKDLEKLEWNNNVLMHYPLWEPIVRQGVDAIFLTEKGQEETRLTHPKNLYGWDCASVLVINPHSVTEETKYGISMGAKRK